MAFAIFSIMAQASLRTSLDEEVADEILSAKSLPITRVTSGKSKANFKKQVKFPVKRNPCHLHRRQLS